MYDMVSIYGIVYIKQKCPNQQTIIWISIVCLCGKAVPACFEMMK